MTDNAEHGGGWFTVLGATDDPVLTMDFVPVPEPKTVKNRLHWDVVGTVEEFLDRGATHLWDRPRWSVLADPEGNEFCVFPEPLVEEGALVADGIRALNRGLSACIARWRSEGLPGVSRALPPPRGACSGREIACEVRRPGQCCLSRSPVRRLVAGFVTGLDGLLNQRESVVVTVFDLAPDLPC